MPLLTVPHMLRAVAAAALLMAGAAQADVIKLFALCRHGRTRSSTLRAGTQR